MKKLLIGTAIVAVLSSAAFAQSYNPGYGTGNIAPVVGSLANGYPVRGSTETGARAYAQAPQREYSYSAYAQAPRGSQRDLRAGAERNDSGLFKPYGVTGGRGWFSTDGW